MECKNESLGVSFTVPDKVTVRMQLAYYSNSALARGRDMLEHYWLGALCVMQSWKCELIPNAEELDLDEASDPKITDIILWAGLQVKTHMESLGSVPKN